MPFREVARALGPLRFRCRHAVSVGTKYVTAREWLQAGGERSGRRIVDADGDARRYAGFLALQDAPKGALDAPAKRDGDPRSHDLGSLIARAESGGQCV